MCARAYIHTEIGAFAGIQALAYSRAHTFRHIKITVYTQIDIHTQTYIQIMHKIHTYHSGHSYLHTDHRDRSDNACRSYTICSCAPARNNTRKRTNGSYTNITCHIYTEGHKSVQTYKYSHDNRQTYFFQHADTVAFVCKYIHADTDAYRYRCIHSHRYVQRQIYICTTQTDIHKKASNCSCKNTHMNIYIHGGFHSHIHMERKQTHASQQGCDERIKVIGCTGVCV